MPKIDLSTDTDGLSVLALFDGIGSGKVALDRRKIPVSRYLSSEIDEKANLVNRSNHKGYKNLGDVRRIRGYKAGKIDLLIGGSPCQSFSAAGDGAGFDDPRGNLLLEYVRLLNEIKPKYFLLENVCMTLLNHNRVSSLLGRDPHILDSSLWSAQKRLRSYWTDIPLKPLPKSNALVIANVLIGDHPPIERRFLKPVRTGVIKSGGQGDRIYSVYGKSITLNSSSGGTAGPGNLLVGTPESYRKLVPIEAERLQTLPDDYTRAVSTNQRHRLIGNGWTINVICHLLSGIQLL